MPLSVNTEGLAPKEPPPGARNGLPRIRLLLAFVVVTVAYFYRIDRPLLWVDEADTGILARSVLHCGYPQAHDGTNVCIFQTGTQVNRDFLCTKVGWSQFYVGALSLALCGNHTAGLRFLFVFIGLLAFFPLYAILKPRVP